MVYLGLKPSYQPEKYGFGNHNTWHFFDWDMNTMWESGRKLDVEKAWLFISTPTTHSSDETSTPPGGHIMEIGTFTPYAPFKAALDRSHHDYMTLKMDFAERMIDLVVEHHVPDLRDHIEVKVVGSPTTNEDFCLAPLGNAYGSAMRPENTTTRLDDRTPFKNLYWCNASSGSPGIYGTVLTGMNLFERLEISAD
jgi:phytoene dehydrogenase-like protein